MIRLFKHRRPTPALPKIAIDLIGLVLPILEKCFDSDWNMTYSEMVTDALIAGGYTKPRTISTVEELDSLAVDSVVMESEEDSFIIRTMRGVFHRFPDGWYVVAGYGARNDIALPATVLFEPQP